MTTQDMSGGWVLYYGMVAVGMVALGTVALCLLATLFERPPENQAAASTPAGESDSPATAGHTHEMGDQS